MSNTIDEKLELIEKECETYLNSLGLKVKYNPEWDQLLSMNLDSLRLLDEESTAEFCVLASLYSLYIQTEFNRHSRKLKWAEHNLDVYIGRYAKDYGDSYTKYEEKRSGVICEHTNATKLAEMVKISQVYCESLNFISKKIETISNTLLELKRSKHKYRGE